MNIRIRFLTVSAFFISLILTSGTKPSFSQIATNITVNTNSTSRYLKDHSPHAVLQMYLNAMKNGNSNPDLPIYTKATRKWKKTWTVTPTQMANEARDIQNCGKGQLKSRTKHSVIRYSPTKRTCSPFYFLKEDGAWRLDFLTMMKTMRFNQQDFWHFSSMSHPYMFAFKDWKFDKNGYPHK